MSYLKPIRTTTTKKDLQASYVSIIRCANQNDEY